MTRLIRNWREAATLILCTPRNNESMSFNDKAVCNIKNSGYPVPFKNNGSDTVSDGITDSFQFNILMLKRSSRSKFLPNVYVFPGGISDDVDFSPEWMRLFHSYGEHLKNSELFASCNHGNIKASSSVFSKKRDVYSSISGEVGMRICAIRETFEESGVLIAKQADDIKPTTDTSFLTGPVWGSSVSFPIIKEWRARVIQQASQFLVMCRELNLVPDVWSLYKWSNWLTPVINSADLTKHKRRFDTAFFVCCIPDIVHTVEDQGEMVHSLWSSPQLMVQQWQQSEVGLAGPQLYELSRLRNFHHVQDLQRFLLEISSHRPERWMGVFCVCKDVLLELLPGDTLYPVNVNCNKDAVIFREETHRELKAKFPQTNRLVYSLQPKLGRLLAVDCNVHLPSHVTPVDVTLIQSNTSNKCSWF